MAATKLVGVNRGLREVHQLLGSQASVMSSFDIATSLVLMSPRALTPLLRAMPPTPTPPML